MGNSAFQQNLESMLELHSHGSPLSLRPWTWVEPRIGVWEKLLRTLRASGVGHLIINHDRKECWELHCQHRVLLEFRGHGDEPNLGSGKGQHHQREWRKQRGLEYDKRLLYLSPRVQWGKEGWHWWGNTNQSSRRGVISHIVHTIILNEIKILRSRWSGNSNSWMCLSSELTNHVGFSREYYCI